MKVKVIYAHSFHEAEDRVNEFIDGKKILDIKFSVNYVGHEDHYIFLVTYDG